MSVAASPLADLLAQRRLCVCVGAGGVGKTTASAAIALALAARGRRVALVTIDPSRRLVGALALSELSNEPRPLSREHLAATGLELNGELSAMVLDPKRTFDELVGQLASDERTRDRVLRNRIYRELSGAVGGSHEFTAVAKLYELDRLHDYDAIVLDTPPSRNALDFLRAPQRIVQLFDAGALRLLLAPAGLGVRLAGRAGAPALALLRHLVGVDLLAEIALFGNAIGGLIGGMRERATAVEALLHDSATTFVIVSSPESEPVRESIAFAGELRDAGLPLGGVIVNRVHSAEDSPQDALEEALRGALGSRLAGIVAASERRARLLRERDRAGAERLLGALAGVPHVLIPELDSGLGELARLGAVTAALTG